MGSTFDVTTLKNDFISSVRSQFADFLDQNAAAAALLERVGLDYANLTVQYQLATDEEAKIGILTELRRVENTLELETDALEDLAAKALMEQFKASLKVVLNFAVQNLPTILAAI